MRLDSVAAEGPQDPGGTTCRGITAFRFGAFVLDCGTRRLLEEGQPIRLGSRAIAILQVLLEQPGEVLSRRELLDRVWPHTVVVDANLTVHIGALRQALGDGRPGRRFIVNIQGRGYSFVAPVEVDRGAALLAVRTEAVQHNLPLQLTHLVGRSALIADLAASVTSHRMTSLIGPAGIGKTQLSLNVAHQMLPHFPHGVWVVELAAVEDPMLVASALAEVLWLGVRSDDPVPGLIAALQQRRTLIVLDNCEHLIDSIATLADALLRGTTDVHLLITSRETLRIQGEQIKRIAPLEMPPENGRPSSKEALGFSAVQLFVERATAALPDFELSDADAPFACAICRKLEGMPLAIELAAARVEALGVRTLAERLDDRLKLLTGGRRSALPRHKTLTAALEWSYRLLAPEEQKGLRGLAVFAGGFTLEAAQEVAGLAAEEVVKLVDRSLVVVEVGDCDARFRLLQTTRAYTLDRLEEAGETDSQSRKHAAFWGGELQRHGDVPGGRLRELFVADVDNIRAALHWAFSESGDDALAVKLAAGSAQLWIELSLLAEAGRWSRRAIAFMQPGQFPAGEMLLHSALGLSLLYTEGVSEEAAAALRRARELSNGAGDYDWQLQVLVALSWIAHRKEDYDGSLQMAHEARGLADASQDPIAFATADWLTGVSHFFRANYRDALAFAQSACDRRLPPVRRAHIASWEIEHATSARCLMANTHWAQGRLEQAWRAADDRIEHALAEGHAVSQCMSLTWAGCGIPLRLGRLERAELAISKLQQLAKANGLANMYAAGLCFEGQLRARLGELEQGIDLMQEGLLNLRRGGSLTHYTAFVSEFALLLLAAGRVGAALERADEAVQRAERHGSGWWQPETMRVKAEVLIAMQRDEAASELLQRSLAMAHGQAAQSWVLRTSLSLAKLHLARGRVEGAREAVRGGLSGFSEGLQYEEPAGARQFLESIE
ncbi:ATP-binding protein [Roseateles sp.]|uniref:ATP-binding protein n=1 Tax=Roseateles sp. TaxID=1971397 RepID=UPI0039E84040